jgi:hypothetical protein
VALREEAAVASESNPFGFDDDDLALMEAAERGAAESARRAEEDRQAEQMRWRQQAEIQRRDHMRQRAQNPWRNGRPNGI